MICVCLVALVIYFGLQVNVSASLLTPLWGTDLLSDQVMYVANR